MITTRELTKSDPDVISRLAALHVESLPGSQISKFGTHFTAAFYRYVIRSPQEVVIASLDGGTVMGAAMLSFDTESLGRRLSRCPEMRMAMVVALFNSGEFRRYCLSRLRKAEKSDDASVADDWHGKPELVHLFADAALRGAGLGSTLVRECEQACIARGFEGMRTKTVLDDDNAALRFYPARGYHRVGETHELGKTYAAFVRDLTDTKEDQR